MSGFTSSGQALDKTENYDYDACDQLTCVDGVGFEYDMNGNLAKKRDDMAGDMVYKFNYANRLREVLFADGTKAQYVYKSDGMRISRTDRTGKTTKYYWDSSAISEALNEADEDGNITLTLFPGTGFKSTRNGSQNSTQWRFFITDHLGSVIALTDSSGIVTDEYEYDEYGNTTSSSGSSHNLYKYIGQQYDDETGLIYLRARYYDSKTGRFISRDPIGIRGGIANYIYTRNSPIQLIDISGLKDLSFDELENRHRMALFGRTNQFITQENVEQHIRKYWIGKLYGDPANNPNCHVQAQFYSWFYKDLLDPNLGKFKKTHFKAVITCEGNGHVAFAIMRCPFMEAEKNNVVMIIDTWTPEVHRTNGSKDEYMRNIVYRPPFFNVDSWMSLWSCTGVNFNSGTKYYNANDLGNDIKVMFDELRSVGWFPEQIVY